MTEGGRSAVQARVRGLVQGVGFRFFVRDAGRRLGLNGWVRNLEDGQSVEVVAEGSQRSLESLIEDLRTGPRGAAVDQVDVTWIEPQGKLDGFQIRR
jgi:acylphosphatase